MLASIDVLDMKLINKNGCSTTLVRNISEYVGVLHSVSINDLVLVFVPWRHSKVVLNINQDGKVLNENIKVDKWTPLKVQSACLCHSILSTNVVVNVGVMISWRPNTRRTVHSQNVTCFGSEIE